MLEEKVLLALVVAALVAIITRAPRRGGPSTGHRLVAGGRLIVAVSSLSLACLRRGRFSCGDCRIRQQCWFTCQVPATEENEGQAAGVVGEGPLCALRDSLERIRRFLQAVRWLLNRFAEVVSSLPIREFLRAVREVQRVARLLPTSASRQVRP